MSNESDQRQGFLHNEFLTSSINASMQHSPTYRKRSDGETETAFNKKQAQFRESFRRELKKLASRYYHQVTIDDETHVAHICMLANTLTKRYSDILHEGKFRIGPAQKALNLYLKYLWCTGKISAPPQCPIDNGVIEKLGAEFAGCKWTKLDDIEKYKAMIAAAKIVAAGNSVTEWELSFWNATNIQRD